jgi:hypothetical protein
MLRTMLDARAHRKPDGRRRTTNPLHLRRVAELNNYSKSLGILLLLAAFAILLHGYHPGVEDDGVYLPAIKRQLNPQLYPHDFEFFTLQLQATIFDKVIAGSIGLSHLPVGIAVLLWHFVSIYLLLWGCWQISRRCFTESYAQWAAVSTVAVLLTLPVAGTALYLADQHLHPRLLASAAILGAIVAVLDRRFVLAAVCLAIAVVVHPLMAGFGITYCIFLAWEGRLQPHASLPVLLFPLGWIFEPASDPWRVAARTRDYYFLSNWQWYEWLGVFAPLILLWWFRRLATRDGSALVARISLRLLWYGFFQFVVALILMLPASLERLKPLQPMRYLHLLYLLFVLISGGLIGRHVLRTHVSRWLLFFVPLGLLMFYTQRQTFPASPHLEFPGTISHNPWIEAFVWIRQNTPLDSYFALDPYYMQRPGQDFHSFRAVAERSALADYAKDPSVATQVPRLAPRWLEQVRAGEGWRHFQAADFQALKSRFGVNWVVLEGSAMPGMDCPHHSGLLMVCRIE